MTELDAGVWLGLVGHDGSCFMHKAHPLSDPDAIEKELFEICKVSRVVDTKQGKLCILLVLVVIAFFVLTH